MAIPPGRYRVIVTRGIEFSHLVREVRVAPGEVVNVTGQLERIVDTRGWVSADYQETVEIILIGLRHIRPGNRQ